MIDDWLKVTLKSFYRHNKKIDSYKRFSRIELFDFAI